MESISRVKISANEINWSIATGWIFSSSPTGGDDNANPILKIAIDMYNINGILNR